MELRNKKILIVLILLLPCSFPARSDEKPGTDKQLRDMSTDRPDKTESPYTVDAGHIQIETSFIDYTYDHNNPNEPQVRMDTVSVVPTNFKVGLLNNTDLQIVLNPYIREQTRDDGAVSVKQGFGDIQTRLKVNLWGNDAGRTAMALMPFIKVPTNSGGDLGNDDIEGGLIVPLAMKLPGDWNMGVMAEFDLNKNATDDNYHTEYINSITFAHAIIGNLNGYVEFFNNISAEKDAKRVSTVDTGLTYALTKDIQLDMGVNIGVTAAADDLNPFCGLSMRY